MASPCLDRAESITTLPPMITLLPRPSSTDSVRRQNSELLPAALPVTAMVVAANEAKRTQSCTASVNCSVELLTSQSSSSLNPKYLRSPSILHRPIGIPKFQDSVLKDDDEEVVERFDAILNQMESMQKQMQRGIEKMQSQIFQLQSCQKSDTLSTEQNHSTSVSTDQSETLNHSVHDTSSKNSLLDSLTKDSPFLFGDPSRVPPRGAVHRGPPLPCPSAFQLSRGLDSSSDDDDDDDEKYPPSSLDYSSLGHLHVSTRTGMKTGVVLNLTSKNHQFSSSGTAGAGVHGSMKSSYLNSQILTKCKLQSKSHTLGKLMSMFCLKKGIKSTRSGLSKMGHETCSQISSLKPTRIMETAKVLTRSCRKSSAFSMRKYRRNSRLDGGQQKFTEKYPPIDVNQQRLACIKLLQLNFSPESKTNNVVLNSDSTVAKLKYPKLSFAQQGCVFTTDGIRNGIARFDVTVSSLTGPCLIGVSSKSDIDLKLTHEGHERMIHGWKNAHEILTESRHRRTRRRVRGTVTNFQVVVDTQSGSMHLRVRQNTPKSLNSSQVSKYTEYELNFDPSSEQEAWHLGIQWTGKGEFRLNGVEIWK
eukprot:g2707.t1